MAGIVPAVAATGLPLSWQLRLLRGVAATGWRQTRLQHWAEAHPLIARGEGWCRRAWWGVAAGGVVQRHLGNANRRSAALRLLDEPDWTEFDQARSAGGVIVATAHLGPPKFLMHVLIERRLPLLVWTNAADLPSWLPATTETTFLDPLLPAERGVLMVKSALHLRRGGVLLGAADMQTGDRSREIDRLGRRWPLSPGLPAVRAGLSHAGSVGGQSGADQLPAARAPGLRPFRRSLGGRLARPLLERSREGCLRLPGKPTVPPRH
jgi:hypothetical protein